MSDWNCQLCRIEKIVKHPNADNLSIATVMTDYPVVIKTGQYEVGQLVGYLAVDAIVPDTQQFYFLCPQTYEKQADGTQVAAGPKYLLGQVPEKNRRLKVKRIRGTFSMGMLVDAPANLNEGDSIVEVLGLKKYEEPEEEDNLVSVKMRGSNADSPPKGWVIPKYDIDGIRKYLICFQENEEVVITEKLNGSCSAYCHDGSRLWVRSRNWFKKPDPTDPWWDIAIRYDLENKLSKFPMMTFFGELHCLVKGFLYDGEIVAGRRQSKIRFFDVWDVQKKCYVDYDDCVSMVKEVGLEMVPELYRGPWKGRDAMYQYAEGLTTLGGKHIREGIVVKPVKERYEPKLDGRLVLKLIGEGYSLQK